MPVALEDPSLDFKLEFIELNEAFTGTTYMNIALGGHIVIQPTLSERAVVGLYY